MKTDFYVYYCLEIKRYQAYVKFKLYLHITKTVKIYTQTLILAMKIKSMLWPHKCPTGQINKDTLTC